MTAIEERPRVDLSRGLLDADDVASLLRVKRSTVYELARRAGDPLPSVRVGRSRRFVLADIEQWLARDR